MRLPPCADRQGGAFSRRQARAAGFARATVTRRVASGAWRPVLPGVLVERGTPVTPLTRAWAGHLATGGVVSHWSAAELLGIAREATSIHVVSRQDLHVAVPGVTEHRIRLGPDEVDVRGGLPVTSRLRTVLDLLGSADPREATTLLFRAAQQGWVDERRLDAAIRRRHGQHGTKQLRSLRRLLGTDAHSAAEQLLHALLDDMSEVEWSANRSIATAAGRFVADVVITGTRILLEVDGERFHSSTERFVADRRRQNALVAEGWTVLRFTWWDLVERPGEVQRVIRETLAVPSVTKVRRTGP